MICKFVGVHCIMGEQEFTSIGQRVELSDEQYAEMLAAHGRGGTFIPEEDFDVIFSTEEDKINLAKYDRLTYFGQIPAKHEAKIEEARSKFRQLVVAGK